MSYDGISVRDVLNRINAPTNGWFLPEVQRQYVWGARHESEDYVCLLLDSLLKGYPIGGIVLWQTDSQVPYRQFIGDYAPGQFTRLVDAGLWGASKLLVYDGQQRLQTLYSVLRHRFNGRVLHFDVLFDQSKAEPDETGFLFRDTTAASETRYLRLTELAVKPCTEEEKIRLEDRLLTAAEPNDSSQKLLIRKNLSALWKVFVDTGVKSIACFSVKADNPAQVNEVFRRLNTGGMPLTELELVLGKLKAVHPDYEERLWAVSNTIKSRSGGIEFSSSAILQYLHLLIKNTVRIDANRIDKQDVEAFKASIQNNNPQDDMPYLIEVFEGYFKRLLNINHASIIPRWLAVLPIATYLRELGRNGHEWRIRAMDSDHVKVIHQYFLLAQLCDWNTQTIVNSFAREAMIAGKAGQQFPLAAIRAVAIEKNRTGELHEYQLLSQPWLTTKVLMPSRAYVFHDNIPQVDHIFPLKLAGHDDNYREAIDVLWNFQPIPAEINNYKKARHPKEFLQSEDGRKYYSIYDFIPPIDSPLWDNCYAFLDYRKKEMLSSLDRLYGLTVATPTSVTQPE